MIFNSATFLVFFFIFFPVYWFINKKSTLTYRNVFIIISSYIFYGWWDWRFLSLIFISSLTDFIIGFQLSKTSRRSTRKTLLISSIIINLGILGFFKYYNFFLGSLYDLLGIFSLPVSLKTLNIILPVGISFYTFQTLTYTIDIYNRKIEPTKNIIAFFAFVSFFPQLVAGPIERAGHLLNQFLQEKTFSYNDCVAGFRLILWGLFKKIVIADNFGLLADNIFSAGQPISGLSTILGALFFAFQIYADFSGYSDIAIGLAKTLGFDLMKNFNTPYFATSFRDFWRRWHISLSTWFRDYLYIPLGGSRRNNFRVSVNIMTTFLLSGLWHGANFTFLLWGGLHGTALILERRLKKNISRFLYAPFVFACVILFWLSFRSKNFAQFIDLSRSIISFGTYSLEKIQQIIIDFSTIRFLSLLVVFTCFLFIEYDLRSLDFNEWIVKKAKMVRLFFYYSLVLIILLLGNFDVKPYFIYFQF